MVLRSNPTRSEQVPPGSSILLSRRTLLRSGGLLAGGVGATAFLAACSAAGAPAWTFPPAAAATGTLGAGSPSPAATASPATSPSAAASAMAGMASPAASAAPATGAREPSPAEYAVPPAFRPARSTPIVFDLTSNDGPDETILIAANPATAYASMNFNHQVPAPVLRLTEGDTVHFTLTNQGQLAHSIDFHAAQTAWSRNYQEVAPGASFSFDWSAQYPGVFMYHCDTPEIAHAR